MINCIAIDDEPFALEVIKTWCEKIPFIHLEKTFTQLSQAKLYLRRFPVDLLFLDIQMPDANGIDFYKTLNPELMVVFTTAFSQYAVEGFNVSALDYVLKPIEFPRFLDACTKAKKQFELLQNSNQEARNYLYVRSEYALVKISFSEILYFETMDDYIRIHILGKKSILTLMSMKKLIEKLPVSEFIRVHRSFVVPLTKIESVRGKSISLGVTEIPIGSSYEKDFFKAYIKQNF
ncbi:MAG: LytTR family DNA-binding domain-containing protein [Fluviicola sp.]|nr:LytTR family DNA-binding domain-containing protein [Fluviicola sp.]